MDTIELVREDKIAQVFTLLFEGLSKKEACSKVGIVEKTFDRHVIAHPELVEQIRNIVRSNFGTFLDAIGNERQKNLKSIMQYAEDLRKIIADNEQEDKDRLNALAALIKVDTFLQRTINSILPNSENAIDTKPKNNLIGDEKAIEILNSLQGAKLRSVEVTKTITFAPEDDIVIIPNETAPK